MHTDTHGLFRPALDPVWLRWVATTIVSTGPAQCFYLCASVCLCGFINNAAVAQSEKVNLRPQWVEGQAAVYEFWNQREQTTTVNFNGQTRDSQMLVTTEGHTRWTVDKAHADGSYTCTMTLLWMTATLEADGQKQTNDTRKPTGDAEPIHKLIKAMADSPVTVTVNADGSIAKVKGIDRMKTKIGKDLEVLIPDPLDFVESASDLATLPFAPTSAAVGDPYKADYRWTHDLGHLDQRWTYTVESIGDLEGVPVATVVGQGKMKLDVDRSEIPNDAPPIDFKLQSGDVTSQVFFDLQRHEAVGRHVTHKERVRVSINLPDGRGKIDRTIDKTLQGQVLRIAEE